MRNFTYSIWGRFTQTEKRVNKSPKPESSKANFVREHCNLPFLFTQISGFLALFSRFYFAWTRLNPCFLPLPLTPPSLPTFSHTLTCVVLRWGPSLRSCQEEAIEHSPVQPRFCLKIIRSLSITNKLKLKWNHPIVLIVKKRSILL